MSSEPNRAASGALLPGSNGLRRAGQHHYSAWRWCIARMKSQNAMAMAAALSYRTIFALIPTMVIVFLILKATGVVEDSKNSLRQLLETAGIAKIQLPSSGGEMADDEGEWDYPDDQAIAPSSTRPAAASAVKVSPPAVANSSEKAATVAEYIEQLMEKVEKMLTFKHLGPVGLALLVWSTITLLTTVERSLNRIFEAPRSRPLLVRVLLYWSAVTIVPIILATVGYFGAKALAVAEQTPVIGLYVVALDVLYNLLLGIFMLACVYKFMPNTPVTFRSALTGAGVVVPLWILAKWGFQLYLDQVVAKGSIYGTLGLLPLFLMWVNICWYAFLFGAQMAYTSAHLKQLEDGIVAEKILLGPLEMLGAAVAVVEGFIQGKGPSTFRQICDKLALPDELTRRLLDRLAEGGVVCSVAGDEDSYVPAVLPQKMPVANILALAQAGASGQPRLNLDSDIARIVQQVKQRTLGAMGNTTLADMLTDSDTTGRRI